MIEAIAAILGLFSAGIFVAHTVDAYGAKGDPTRDGSALQRTRGALALTRRRDQRTANAAEAVQDGRARIPRPAIASRSFRIQNTARRNSRPRRSVAGQRCLRVSASCER
jgi:hypothetical protein